MKQLFSIIIALTLTACATDSSLWGAYPTPTAQIPATAAPVSETPLLTEPMVFTEPFLPAATVTFSPALLLPTLAPPHSSTPGPQDQTIMYYAQSGDSRAAVAARFGVEVQEITSPKTVPATGLIDAGTLLIIPDRIETETTSSVWLLPDSEVIFSSSATDFDTAGFIALAGGHLSQYHQWLGSTGNVTGSQGMQRVTTENSVNPRLMLAVLEYESHWIYGEPTDMLREEYPMGYQVLKYKGFFMHGEPVV
jgi:LasA protease